MKWLKRSVAGALAAALLCALPSCSKDHSSKIVVVTREDGSGTRAAFTELVGFQEDEEITAKAEVVGTNAVMLYSVGGCKTAIGYVSAGVLYDGVKSVAIDGSLPTAEMIRSGDYPIKRNLSLVVPDALTPIAEDFIRFTQSAQARKIGLEQGYVPPDGGEDYQSAGLQGRITLAGSTSVAPVIEAIAESYMELNPGVQIEVQQIGSSAGIQSVSQKITDLGMTSRALTEAEQQSGLQEIVVVYDGIAVIVHRSSDVEQLSMKEVRQIFSGITDDWRALQ